MAQFTLDGSEKKIKVLGLYASIKNNSGTVIYAGQHAGLDPSATNVTPIQAGESISIPANADKYIYLLGTGDVAIISGNEWVNFFKPAPKGGSGGGGTGNGITQQQLNDTLKLYETVANSDKKLENKADKSEIPISLPADGGNSDTVGGYTAERLIQSNTNLLDNPDFKINQRGNDTYTAVGYTVDRWYNRRTNHTTVTVEDDGIRLTDSNISNTLAALNQRIEKPEDLLGKTVTISCLITENESDCLTLVGFYLGNAAYANSKAVGYITVGAGMTGYFAGTVTLPNTTGDYSGINFSIRSYGGTTWDVKAAWGKFEYGKIATPFVPPDPALELLKCQRYYQVLRGSYLPPITSQKYGAIWLINLAVEMRVNPTIILPEIDDATKIVGTRVINGRILGGWTWGNYCFSINNSHIQIQLINTDTSQHDNAYVLIADKVPIALSADL